MYSFKEYIRKNKASLIVVLVIWLLAIIFFVSPVAYSASKSIVNGAFSLELFGEQVVPNISSFTCFFKVFSPETFIIFLKHVLAFTLVYSLFVGIGLWKSRKKGTYDMIEHGSSDWSTGGEQYKILSKNKGIILAENNYLPVNKPGNVNVLIVGRIWCR